MSTVSFDPKHISGDPKVGVPWVRQSMCVCKRVCVCVLVCVCPLPSGLLDLQIDTYTLCITLALAYRDH